MVVSFIMMLKALVDIAPIAFLKVGQDQVGIFDFQITSDYGEPFVDGDTSLYMGDPFAYKKEEKRKNFFDSVIDSSFKNNGDHAEIFGFNLLKFDEFAKKLDPMIGQGLFKGFSPRWIFPTRLRNIHEPALNTSSILIVLDSAREVELDLVPFFGKEILGDSEIMISDSASRHL